MYAYKFYGYTNKKILVTGSIKLVTIFLIIGIILLKFANFGPRLPNLEYTYRDNYLFKYLIFGTLIRIIGYHLSHDLNPGISRQSGENIGKDINGNGNGKNSFRLIRKNGTKLNKVINFPSSPMNSKDVERYFNGAANDDENVNEETFMDEEVLLDFLGTDADSTVSQHQMSNIEIQNKVDKFGQKLNQINQEMMMLTMVRK